ncbi:VOC family protein [Priestia megaterium]|nr:VOC family protein [Priestia megaterium]
MRGILFYLYARLQSILDEVYGNQVNHFGFQVNNAKEVIAHKERLEKEGFFAREEMDTTCCYAVQNKFWVTDPDANEWEFFYTKANSDAHKIGPDIGSNEKVPNTNSCC